MDLPSSFSKAFQAAANQCFPINIEELLILKANKENVLPHKYIFMNTDKKTSQLIDCDAPNPESIIDQVQNANVPCIKKFPFCIPFVYPLAEDIIPICVSSFDYKTEEPISCTQEFNDNFSFMNLTQMLENNNASDLDVVGQIKQEFTNKSLKQQSSSLSESDLFNKNNPTSRCGKFNEFPQIPIISMVINKEDKYANEKSNFAAISNPHYAITEIDVSDNLNDLQMHTTGNMKYIERVLDQRTSPDIFPEPIFLLDEPTEACSSNFTADDSIKERSYGGIQYNEVMIPNAVKHPTSIEFDCTNYNNFNVKSSVRTPNFLKPSHTQFVTAKSSPMHVSSSEAKRLFEQCANDPLDKIEQTKYPLSVLKTFSKLGKDSTPIFAPNVSVATNDQPLFHKKNMKELQKSVQLCDQSLNKTSGKINQTKTNYMLVQTVPNTDVNIGKDTSIPIIYSEPINYDKRQTTDSKNKPYVKFQECKELQIASSKETKQLNNSGFTTEKDIPFPISSANSMQCAKLLVEECSNKSLQNSLSEMSKSSNINYFYNSGITTSNTLNIGFTTGNGAPIAIKSTKAVQRAKRIMDECSKEALVKETSINNSPSSIQHVSYLTTDIEPKTINLRVSTRKEKNTGIKSTGYIQLPKQQINYSAQELSKAPNSINNIQSLTENASYNTTDTIPRALSANIVTDTEKSIENISADAIPLVERLIDKCSKKTFNEVNLFNNSQSSIQNVSHIANDIVPKPQILGFTTGKGTSISIKSTAALKRAKRIMDECSNEELEEPTLTDNVPSTVQNALHTITNASPRNHNIEFTTDRGTSIPIKSIEALKRAKRIMDECSNEELEEPTLTDNVPSIVQNALHTVTNASPRTHNIGFTTGKGTSIPIKSTEALKRAKRIIDECSNEKLEELTLIDNVPSTVQNALHTVTNASPRTHNMGFTTGKGTSIPIDSTEALKRAKRIMDECSNEELEEPTLIDNVPSTVQNALHTVTNASPRTHNMGFTTGKGTSIPIDSTEALKRAKRIMDECSNEELEEPTLTDNVPSIVQNALHTITNASPRTHNIEFTTDRGTSIPIKSTEALKRAKRIMDECSNEELEEPTLTDNVPSIVQNALHTITNASPRTHNIEFTTDRVTSIPIKSTEALKRAKRIMDECSNEELEEPTLTYNVPSIVQNALHTITNASPRTHNMGFTTGKGTSIPIKSTEALKRAKRIMDECSNEELEEPTLIDNVPSTVQNALHTVTNASPRTHNMGFTTGKGTSIPIKSSEALKRAKRIMDECSNEELEEPTLTDNVPSIVQNALHTITNASPRTHNMGFTTGKGTSIPIKSTEALKRAKRIMDECSNEELEEPTLIDNVPSIVQTALHTIADTSPRTHNMGFKENLDDLMLPNVSKSTKPDVSPNVLKMGFPACYDASIFIKSTQDMQRAPLPVNECSKDNLHTVMQFEAKTSQALQKATAKLHPAHEQSLSHMLTNGNILELNSREEPSAQANNEAFYQINRSSSPQFVEEKKDIEEKASPMFDFENSLNYSSFEVDSQIENATNFASLYGTISKTYGLKERRHTIRQEQEEKAAVNYKSTSIPTPQAKQTRQFTSISDRQKPKKVLRQPQIPGQLWQLRCNGSGHISSSLPYKKISIQNLSATLKFPDGVLANFTTRSWCIQSAGTLQFQLDPVGNSDGDAEDIPAGYRLGDDVEVIPNEVGLVGKEEIVRAFVCSPGVARGLASHQWISHHFDQIAWRIGSVALFHSRSLESSLFESASEQIFSSSAHRLLHVLLLQLKYRYDRELEAVERSPIRKILDRDDTPAKRITLCVSQLDPLPSQKFRGRLTDGWYHIDWIPDRVLTRLILMGRIRVGTKLVTALAELTQAPSGFSDANNKKQDAGPDSYLFGEASNGLALRLATNSTRIASPTARLGYAARPPITNLPPLPLCSLFPEGGIVSSVVALVHRRFQLQFMETTQSEGDDADGDAESRKQRVFRDPRSEERATRLHAKVCQLAFDKAVGEFSSPKSSKRSRRSQPSSAALAALGLDGEALWNAVSDAPDPALAESGLSAVQRDAMLGFKEATMHDLVSQSRPKREVTPLLRVQLAGIHPQDVEQNFVVPLTIWNPTEEILSLLKEGAVVQLFRLQVSTTRVNDPFSAAISSDTPNQQSSAFCAPPAGHVLSLSGGRATAVRLLSKTCRLNFTRASSINGESGSSSGATTVGEMVEEVFRPRIFRSLTDLTQFSINSNSFSSVRHRVVDFTACVVGVRHTTMPSLHPTEQGHASNRTSDLSLVYLASSAEKDDKDSGVMAVLKVWGGLERFSLTSVLSNAGSRVSFTDVQVRGCSLFRPNHDFPPEYFASDLQIINLGYSAASYCVTTQDQPRRVRTPRNQQQQPSNFLAYMQFCMEAHFEKSFFSSPSVSFNASYTSILTPGSLRRLPNPAPVHNQSSLLARTPGSQSSLRSFSSLLKGTLFSPAPSPIMSEIQKPHLLTSTSVTPRTSAPPTRIKPALSSTPAKTRTRTGLSRPQSNQKRLSSASIDFSTPSLTSSPRKTAKLCTEQTPIRRSHFSKSILRSTPDPIPLSSSLIDSLMQLEGEHIDEKDSLNVSIADLVKTRRRNTSRECSQTSSSPRTPRSKTRLTLLKSPPP